MVATDGPRSEEIAVTTGHPGDTNNINAKRTYQFDQVFGSDADQSIIYQDVVIPILNEVFDGYNATLCAYGQTGTGKTYVCSVASTDPADCENQLHNAWAT